jgi:GH3 auxin-responsive promoter
LRTAFALLHAAAPRAKLLHGKIACDDPRRPHLPLLARPSIAADGPPACVIDDDSVRLEGGPSVGLLTRPEAPVAVEDARAGGLRLLVDHGVYFEFVPAGQSARLTISEIRPGESYELAVTSPGGWWACRSGLFVAFERTSPPVFRLVEAPVPQTISEPASHRRSADTPAALPETSAHIPWSVPADRG